MHDILDAMSDDDRDIDVDSDDGEDSDSRQLRQGGGNQYYSQADKRAHHNALERKRRDHIKDSFSSLRDSVPALNGEKASRAQILKKAAEYIQHMRTRNSGHQQDIEDLRRQNILLESQIRKLEKAKSTGTFIDGDLKNEYAESESDTSDMEDSANQKQAKKMKIAYH